MNRHPENEIKWNLPQPFAYKCWRGEVWPILHPDRSPGDLRYELAVVYYTPPGTPNLYGSQFYKDLTLYMKMLSTGEFAGKDGCKLVPVDVDTAKALSLLKPIETGKTQRDVKNLEHDRDHVKTDDIEERFKDQDGVKVDPPVMLVEEE